jgi:hypothetical protein
MIEKEKGISIYRNRKQSAHGMLEEHYIDPNEIGVSNEIFKY